MQQVASLRARIAWLEGQVGQRDARITALQDSLASADEALASHARAGSSAGLGSAHGSSRQSSSSSGDASHQSSRAASPGVSGPSLAVARRHGSLPNGAAVGMPATCAQSAGGSGSQHSSTSSAADSGYVVKRPGLNGTSVRPVLLQWTAVFEGRLP